MNSCKVLAPVSRQTGRFVAGVTAGYMRADVTIAGANKTSSRLEINQVPLLAIARRRLLMKIDLVTRELQG